MQKCNISEIKLVVLVEFYYTHMFEAVATLQQFIKLMSVFIDAVIHFFLKGICFLCVFFYFLLLFSQLSLYFGFLGLECFLEVFLKVIYRLLVKL